MATMLWLRGGIPRQSAALLAGVARDVPPTPRPLPPALHRHVHDSGVGASDYVPKPGGPLTLYRDLVGQGRRRYDAYQENMASELDGLLKRLERYEMEMEDYHAKLSTWDSSRENERPRLLVEEAEDKQHDGVWIDEKRGFLDKLISRKRRGNLEPGVGRWVSYLNREKKLDTLVGQKPVAPVAPKGLYLYGNVGSGKTMLMDMFYQATEGVIKHRRRFHFHEAMLEINDRMHDAWKKRDDDKSIQSPTFSWISGLPFDAKIKEWLIGEEKYKQDTQQKHILLAVADKFLVDRQTNKCGASILCFDEIQRAYITDLQGEEQNARRRTKRKHPEQQQQDQEHKEPGNLIAAPPQHLLASSSSPEKKQPGRRHAPEREHPHSCRRPQEPSAAGDETEHDEHARPWRFLPATTHLPATLP